MNDVSAGAPDARGAGPTVVLGLGTPLMADDGLGLAVLDELRAWSFEPDVELVDGGTWGMNLLGVIEDAGRLLLLDAIHAGRPPGALIALRGAELPRYLFTKVSPHQVDLREVLALAEFRGTLPADTVAVGLEPHRVELADALTPLIRGRVSLVVEEALAILAAWGHDVRPRARAAATGSLAGRDRARWRPPCTR
ncbi:MAG TPA: HyaD/HybD family hydrogenase maturation endopeptidase [Gemmatimonadota bacterium]|nr:HyaD/HybD family hydrogenase maturation endopeptidase [Gemmatimonadota bacterium]